MKFFNTKIKTTCYIMVCHPVNKYGCFYCGQMLFIIVIINYIHVQYTCS